MSTKPMILAVDNDATNRELLRWMLREDYELLEAENIRQASAILEQGRDQEAISLIVFGLAVSKNDMLSLLEECSADKLLSLIPAIATLSESESSVLSELFSCGLSDYCSFPYDPVIFRRKVFNLVGLRTADKLVGQMAYDPLTGLYAEPIFYREAQRRISEDLENDYILICSDFENFKLVNKLYGDKSCNELLCAYARLLEGFGGENAICGRLAMDDFAILMPNPDELCLPSFDNHPLAPCVSLRFGIYPVEQRDMPVSEMCACALSAARSFSGGTGTHCVRFDRVFHQKYLQEQAIASELENALKSGQFKVYYQPKVNLHNEKISGAEAFVRWEHPVRGLLSAAEFLPLFKRSGLICKLDQFVWSETCAHLQSWICKGICTVPVSINVSRATLYDPSTPQKLKSCVRSHGLSPDSIFVAVNEASYADDPKQLFDLVSSLKSDGFRIEMDGFGSGYSSLFMLSRFPIDVLNVSLDFIRQDFRRESKNVFSFIISLAKWMDLRITVECVEDGSWIESLRSIDCNYAQGYYYAKPMPADEYERFLQRAELDLESAAPPSSRAASSEAVSIRGMASGKRTMLVADDSTLSRTVLSRIFRDSFQIAEVGNGSAALEYLDANLDKVSIVLLDLIMPVMDGFETLEHIRSSPNTRNLPVIVIAQPGDASERKALALGADDFIAKPFDDGIVMRRVFNVIDSATLREQRRQIENKHAILQEAFIDYLTGTYNRRGLEGAWERLPELCGGYYALIMIDLDNFKQCNDVFGHDFGDDVLRRFSSRLRGLLRGSDVVARIGGDEFLVVMNNILSPEAALNKGKQLCAGLVINTSDPGITVTCSMGIVVFDSKPESIDALLQQADKAMYHAKQNGKNSCFLWNEELEASVDKE